MVVEVVGGCEDGGDGGQVRLGFWMRGFLFCCCVGAWRLVWRDGGLAWKGVGGFALITEKVEVLEGEVCGGGEDADG